MQAQLPDICFSIQKELQKLDDSGVFDHVIGLLTTGDGIREPQPEQAVQLYLALLDTGIDVSDTTIDTFASPIEQQVSPEHIAQNFCWRHCFMTWQLWCSLSENFFLLERMVMKTLRCQVHKLKKFCPICKRCLAFAY